MCAEDFSIDFRWYNSMEKRLVTFKGWTGCVKPKDLAQAGFYYLGKKDTCRCCCCGVEVSKWVENDMPFEWHLKNCTFTIRNNKKQYNIL